MTTRIRRAHIARQTVDILDQRAYHAPSGVRVDLATALERAEAATVQHLPEATLPPIIPRDRCGERTTKVTVANEATLTALRRLAGTKPVALNFASAKNPGGGFLNGSEAQEESLARASALYLCLKGSTFYAYHRAQADPVYSHRVLYSPDVPIFRDEAGTLLERPYLASFITCAAVNKGALQPEKLPYVRDIMQERVSRVLQVAAVHRHDTLVLGAFGCGVFQNDPAEVAQHFHNALTGRFRQQFAHVHFAVLDQNAGPCISAFKKEFG